MRGGNEGGNGAEAGGGDACLEMRRARRGCIDADVGAGSECSEALLSFSLFISFTKRKKKRALRALTPPRHKRPIQTTHSTPWNHNRSGLPCP